MKYLVSIAHREVVVEVYGERILVDSQEFVAHLVIVPGTPFRHLLLGDRSYTFALAPRGRGQWTIGVQGERLDVDVVDERTRHIRSLAAASRGPGGGGVLRAPMPGLVVRVSVAEGQSVQSGAGLVVLEAMKMENELKATAAARVRAVRVQQGEAVEKGQVLVEFEEDGADGQSGRSGQG